MKILEAQSAVLTNYEVYQHVSEQRERYKNAKRRGPPNLETVVREVRFFHSISNLMPRNTTDTPYSSSNIFAQTPVL